MGAIIASCYSSYGFLCQVFSKQVHKSSHLHSRLNSPCLIRRLILDILREIISRNINSTSRAFLHNAHDLKLTDPYNARVPTL